MITELDRIKFIQTIDGFDKVNPYMDLIAITKIKRLLVEANLYKVDANEVKYSSIMNLLLKAQGKRPLRTTKHKSSTKDSRKKVVDL